MSSWEHESFTVTMPIQRIGIVCGDVSFPQSCQSLLGGGVSDSWHTTMGRICTLPSRACNPNQL